MELAAAYLQCEQAALAGAGLMAHSVELQLGSGPVQRARLLEAGEGPPILFVHGGGGIPLAWAPLMACLPGWRLLAVERPGSGAAAPFDYTGVDLRAHAVGFLTAVLDALDLSAAPIVGNSMGATWSLWLALDRPERAERLALLGCPAVVLGTSAPAGMRLLGTRLGRRMLSRSPSDEVQMRRVFRQMGQDDQRVPTALIEAGAAAGRLPGFAPTWSSLLHNVLTLWGPRVRLEADELAAVKCPVSIIWGTADPFGDTAVARRLADILHADLNIVGRGHLPWLDEPAESARLLEEFLPR